MQTIDDLVRNFLSQKSIAVAGVSDSRETGCNLVYRNFKRSGYRVYPVNPHMTSYKGEPCYPDLKSLPQKPDAVFIFTNPMITENLVQQCVDLRIGHVWMHCMMGTKPGLTPKMTSVSSRAVELCRRHHIEVIPGSCPNQFLNPDIGHRMMKGIWRFLRLLPPPH